MFSGILHRVSNVDLVVDDVDAVGRESFRKIGVGERAGECRELKVPVEDVDGAGAKV